MSYSRVVKNFLDIVQIDSPTGNESRLANEIVNQFEKLNLQPSIDQVGNVIVHLEGDKQKETLFFAAHLDTVEPGRGIVPVIENDNIYSKENTILGADNKTAIAAIIEILSRLHEEGVSHHPLDIVFTVSEESGNHGAHGLDYSKIRAKRGYISDASGYEFGDLIIASPFYSRFDINITGKAAHASTPEQAINALSIFAESYSQIPIGRVSQNTTCNIGIAQAGQVINTIPGEFTCSGEVRSMVESELDEVVENIQDVFKSTAENLGGTSHVSVVRENGGFSYDDSEEFMIETKRFLKSQQIHSKLIRSWGCYDANVFVENGIQVLNIADGSQGAHTSSEHISIYNLERLSDIFYKLALGSS